MNVCGVTFGGYFTKILSFKTGNLLNNSKFHLLSEGTVQSSRCSLPTGAEATDKKIRKRQIIDNVDDNLPPDFHNHRSC